MNILLLASHSVAEYDDIRMFTDMGYDVFCPGGYQNPSDPGESLRPALPDAPYHPDLAKACDAVRREKGDPGYMIDWAKGQIPDAVLDWADVIICHHFPERWIGMQWSRIRHKRVIWRTCGQSSPDLELQMRPLRSDGLQIVRYSPREAVAFGEIDAFAGEDALIRFGKYPEDYGPWIGDLKVVGNVTQDMKDRGEATGLGFWLAATEGLEAVPAGKGSESLPGGIGELDYYAMLGYLRHIRTYLYVGTRPASYTLGLIEAMMSGVPVVSVPAEVWGSGWGGWELFEAHHFAYGSAAMSSTTTVGSIIDTTKMALTDLLRFDEKAANASRVQREMAVEYFGIERIKRRWSDFLEGRAVEEEPPVSWYERATA